MAPRGCRSPSARACVARSVGCFIFPFPVFFPPETWLGSSPYWQPHGLRSGSPSSRRLRVVRPRHLRRLIARHRHHQSAAPFGATALHRSSSVRSVCAGLPSVALARRCRFRAAHRPYRRGRPARAQRPGLRPWLRIRRRSSASNPSAKLIGSCGAACVGAWPTGAGQRLEASVAAVVV